MVRKVVRTFSAILDAFEKTDGMDKDIRKKFRLPSEAEVNCLSPGIPFPIGSRHRFSMDLEESDDIEWVKSIDNAIYKDSLQRKGRRVRALSANTRFRDEQAEQGSVVMSLGRGATSRPSSAPFSSQLQIIMMQKDKGSTALATALVQSQEVARRPLSAMTRSISPHVSERRESKLIDSYRRTISGRVRPTSAPSANAQAVATLVSPLPHIDEEVVEDDAGLDGEDSSYLFSPNQSLHYYGHTRNSKPIQRRGSDDSSSSSSTVRDQSPPSSRPLSGVSITGDRPPRPQSATGRPFRPLSGRPSPLPPRPSSALVRRVERPMSAALSISAAPSGHKIITVSTSSINEEQPIAMNHLQIESRQRPQSAISNGITLRNPAGPSVVTSKSHKAYQRQSASCNIPSSPLVLVHTVSTPPTSGAMSLEREVIMTTTASATSPAPRDRPSSSSPGRHRRALLAAQESFASLLHLHL